MEEIRSRCGGQRPDVGRSHGAGGAEAGRRDGGHLQGRHLDVRPRDRLRLAELVDDQEPVRRAHGLQARHDRADPRPRGKLHHLGRRAGLHLQAAQRRQVPQWPRAARLGHQVLDRARGESRDAEPRPGVLRAHQRLRRNGVGRGEGAVGHHHARRLHRPDRAVAARCDVPAHRRDQFRLRRAARGGREVRPGLRPQSGGHRRLQDDRVDARPARRVRA